MLYFTFKGESSLLEFRDDIISNDVSSLDWKLSTVISLGVLATAIMVFLIIWVSRSIFQLCLFITCTAQANKAVSTH